MKTKIIFAFVLAFSFLCNTSFGSLENSETSPLGVWNIKINTGDESNLSAKIGITQKENSNEYEGYLKVLIKKSDMENFQYDKKNKKLKFKADMIFSELSFDLTFKGNHLEGTVEGSDGMKGTVKGIRKE